MAKNHIVTVSLDVRIYDPAAFAAAAVARAIQDGSDPKDARATYTTRSLAACAQMLLDPGTIGAGDCGATIIESRTE